MDYSFKDSEQTVGFSLCVKRVNELLNDAKILLENGGNVHTVMGLYTFAVEEYGKALLIQKNSTLNSKFFGNFPSNPNNTHNKKSNEAVKVLPDLCTEIRFAVTFFGWERELEKKSSISNRQIRRTLYTSGIFEDGSNEGPNTLADFDTRMECFYVDWDNDRRVWLSKPEIEMEGLKTAILQFQEHLLDA